MTESTRFTDPNPNGFKSNILISILVILICLSVGLTVYLKDKKEPMIQKNSDYLIIKKFIPDSEYPLIVTIEYNKNKERFIITNQGRVEKINNEEKK